MGMEKLERELAELTGLLQAEAESAEQAKLIEEELRKCAESAAYFIDTYCFIYDSETRDYIRFRLWPEQVEALNIIHGNQSTIALKARQLGLSWLVVSYAIWTMIFQPIANVLLFSKGDAEAKELTKRLEEILNRLPEWMCPKFTATAHTIDLANGSRARSFPTTSGESYTATLAIIDEADKLPPSTASGGALAVMLARVKPTIDAGGKLVLVSTVDKGKPQSLFKNIYRAAKTGQNDYRPIFLPWNTRPGRTQEWYEKESKSCLANTGSLDHVHQEYPASDLEALAPRVLDKRIPPAWLEQCYREVPKIISHSGPPIPQLEVYKGPERGRRYVIGGDPAEGNPTSDDSALTVLDEETGEEVCALAGKFQPAVFAAHIDAIGHWYNDASVMVERNNHGHAVLLWLRDNSILPILCGHDDAEGWLSSSKGKAQLYSDCADAFREEETILHSFSSYMQLSSIEGATLRAPEGEHDDRADSYALAWVGLLVERNRPKDFVAGDPKQSVLHNMPADVYNQGGRPEEFARIFREPGEESDTDEELFRRGFRQIG
jgi:hypothetical protein